MKHLKFHTATCSCIVELREGNTFAVFFPKLVVFIDFFCDEAARGEGGAQCPVLRVNEHKSNVLDTHVQFVHSVIRYIL